jgi:5'(3')-deoxyribonucleotidase
MENPKIRIAVDVDEVLATFVEGLANFHNHHYGTQLTLADFSSYEFVEVWGGSQEDTAKKVLHFFETDFFLQLGTVPKAYETLKELKETGHFEFIIVTSRNTNLEPHTRTWIERHFPEIFSEMAFGNIYGEGKKYPKPELCRKHETVLLIDDSLKYAKECSSHGIPVLLFDLHGTYPWNKYDHEHESIKESPEYKHIKRVQHWDHVKEHLLQMAQHLNNKQINN